MSTAPTAGHLKHRAIISTDNYQTIDHPLGNTDARALSIGKAQWDHNEISAKIWRRPNDTWSVQSEEMRLHRALDITIMILSTMLDMDDRKFRKNYFLDLTIVDESGLGQVYDELLKQKPELDDRLHEIKLLLKKYLPDS